jgi:uncharacterized protein
MDQGLQQSLPIPEIPDYSVPWKAIDNWLGVALLVVIDAILIVVVLQGLGAQLAQSAGIVLIELAYLLPVVVILAWRRISWKHLGFGSFDWKTLGLGCGLLIGGYILILLHNGILMILGVDTQGEAILKIFASLDSPVWFLIVAVIVAPLVEEIFFRGFLFQGFRQKYGWLGATLLSSAIFAAAHLDLVSLIPTFILGVVLAYTYHKSNSVWPGIVLHFLVNAFGACGAYAASQLQNVIPL